MLVATFCYEGVATIFDEMVHDKTSSALVELFLVLGNQFQEYDMEILGTKYEDVSMEHDVLSFLYVGFPWL